MMRVVALILLVVTILLPVTALTGSLLEDETCFRIHVVCGIIFVIAAVFHAVLNRRTLKFFITGKKGK